MCALSLGAGEGTSDRTAALVRVSGVGQSVCILSLNRPSLCAALVWVSSVGQSVYLYEPTRSVWRLYVLLRVRGSTKPGYMAVMCVLIYIHIHTQANRNMRKGKESALHM